jgi:hypothetical protein
VLAWRESDDRVESPCPSYKPEPTSPADAPKSDFPSLSCRNGIRTPKAHCDARYNLNWPFISTEVPSSKTSKPAFDPTKNRNVNHSATSQTTSWLPKEGAESILLESPSLPLPPNLFVFTEVDDRMDSPCPSYRSHMSPLETPRGTFSLLSGRTRLQNADSDSETGNPTNWSYTESSDSTPSTPVLGAHKFGNIFKSRAPSLSSPSTIGRFIKRILRLDSHPL